MQQVRRRGDGRPRRLLARAGTTTRLSYGLRLCSCVIQKYILSKHVVYCLLHFLCLKAYHRRSRHASQKYSTHLLYQ